MSSAVLIITLCLAGTCHDVSIPMDELTVAGCNEIAQSAIAMWIMDYNPEYTVSKWRCAEPGEHDI